MNNPFTLQTTEYKRDLDLLGTYIEDAALYLSKNTGQPLEVCTRYVKNNIKPGAKLGFVDPQVRFLERQANGDRIERHGTMYGYLQYAIKENELISPTYTTYLPTYKKESLLVGFIDHNKKIRNKAKKEMYAAKAAGDLTVETFKKQEQNYKKISNNSLSGAHCSASTVLFNKTAHSTLTSACRTTSGYGNANNEKFLAGNRHYWSPDIVRNNITSIINHTDYPALERVMQKYGIRHPTPEETMECIIFSSQLYWKAKKDVQSIEKYVYTLTDIERSAFVYTGDLYHLRKYNPEVVRILLSKLSYRSAVPHPDPESLYKEAPDSYVHLAAQIHSIEMKGVDLKKSSDKPIYAVVASTTENLMRVVTEYEDFIKALWVTNNVPASLAVFPTSVRRIAITSDTDSTIFTVMEWVEWFTGGHELKDFFHEDATAVAGVMVFLASELITHLLAKMSANFGIETKRLHDIAMKNEFYFPVFIPTQVAKHYFAYRSIQEGLVLKALETEIKGVHLKSSNVPKFVMKEAELMMTTIMDTIMKGEMISLQKMLTWVANIERDVYRSIEKGSYEYFRRAQIKTADGYKQKEDAAPYQQYEFWNATFGKFYGEIPPPPYTGIKISVELDTPTKVQDWILEMQNKDLANLILEFMKAKGKRNLGSNIILPEVCIQSRGIPKEILDAAGARKIVINTTQVFYIILETLGYYELNGKITRLISDIY